MVHPTNNRPKYAHVFIDVSNIWIGGQRTSAAAKNLQTPIDPTWRFSARNFFSLVEKERNVVVHSRFLFGSEMRSSPRDNLWRRFQEDVDVVAVNFRSQYTRKEVDVDKSLTMSACRLADSLLYLAGIESAEDLERERGKRTFRTFAQIAMLDADNCTFTQVWDLAHHSVVILALGDGGFAHDAEEIVAVNGLPVEIWSWECTYSTLKFGGSCARGTPLTIKFLDAHLDEIGFTARFNIRSSRIPQASSFVFQRTNALVPRPIEAFLRTMRLPYYTHFEANGDLVVVIASLPTESTAECITDLIQRAKFEIGDESVMPYVQYIQQKRGPSVSPPTGRRNVFDILSSDDGSDEDATSTDSGMDSECDAVRGGAAEEAFHVIDYSKRQPQVKKGHHTIRCAFRAHCHHAGTKGGCEYFHTEEERSFVQKNGPKRPHKIRMCNAYPNCQKPIHACNFAHGIEDLICPTCDGKGHAMEECARRFEPAPATRLLTRTRTPGFALHGAMQMPAMGY